MIGITGASGTLSGGIIKQLEAARAPFRAACFSKDKKVTGKAPRRFTQFARETAATKVWTA